MVDYSMLFKSPDELADFFMLEVDEQREVLAARAPEMMVCQLEKKGPERGRNDS